MKDCPGCDKETELTICGVCFDCHDEGWSHCSSCHRLFRTRSSDYWQTCESCEEMSRLAMREEQSAPPF